MMALRSPGGRSDSCTTTACCSKRCLRKRYINRGQPNVKSRIIIAAKVEKIKKY
jgi:hypothetical protein